MAMIPEEVVIRKEICRTCKAQCPEYVAGQIDHANPCVACPVNIWHAFEGPGCVKVEEPSVAPEPAVIEPRFAMEPGSLLKWVIWKLTETVPCAMCNQRAKQMNEWGWGGCWLHRDEIIGWITHEAKARGHEIGQVKAFSLFLAAMKELGGSPE